MKKKLIISNTILIFISLILMLVFSGLIINNTNKNHAKNELQSILNIAVNYYDGENADRLVSLLEDTSTDLRVTIINPDGSVLIDSLSQTEENHLNRPEIQHINTFYTRFSETVNKQMLYLATVDEGKYIRVSIPLSSINSLIHQYILFGTLIFMILLILSSTFIYFNTRNIYKPIEQEINKISTLIDKPKEYKGNDIDVLSQEIEEVKMLIEAKIHTIEMDNQKMDFILNSIQQGLIILNDKQKVVLMNEYASVILQFEKEKAIDKNFIYLIRDNQLQMAIEIALKTSENKSLDVSIDGRIYLVLITLIEGTWVSSSKTPGLSLLFIDVTSSRNMERMKRDFFANASHELKSPLTSIIGYQQLIKEGMLSTKKEIEDATLHTLIEANKMNTLIKEMLDLSKLEAKTPKEMTEVNLKDLIHSALDSFNPLIQEKNIAVSFNEQDFIIKMDSQDGDKLIRNILENAIKYNKINGNININIDTSLKKLVIEDTGKGISQSALPHIFERFYREDKASSSYAGTGLGLSIVKHICSNYSYKVDVKSELKKGTTFIIYF